MLRIVIIGCGAVAEKYHMPIIAGHDRAVMAVFVDRDLSRAQSLADAYNVPKVTKDLKDLDQSIVDAAIICTPPFHHAPAAIELLQRGIHVLVEKPIATNSHDAIKMVECADQHHAVLAVSVFRRLLPSLRLLKKAIDQELLGPVTGFQVQGGGVYLWEAVSLGNMLKSQAGGGVLMDMAPHYFDQLLYLFGGPGEVMEYYDDSLGGIESNCMTQLKLTHHGKPVVGTVEINRTHALPNEFIVNCRDGDLVIPPSDRYRVLIRKRDWTLHDGEGNSGDAEFSMAWKNEPETPWLKNYKDEIDDWLNAIETKTEPKLSGRSALPVMQLIDRCYESRIRISHSWEPHTLINAPYAPDAKVLDSARRILITGASGFIGCRLAEILSQRNGYRVRAAVHNPANASRIARLPVELVQADLGNSDDAMRITKDCDAIVHCAIGTETGNRKRVFEITVGGTNHLLRAAEKESVRHFVHLSTIAVHSDDWRGIIDENTPTEPGRGNTYGESKLAAELAVRGGKLPFTVIRPGCVYGPYGKTFITNPIRAMTEGRLVLSGAEHTPSNTVYVDSLCEAIVLSLESSKSLGKIFSLADDDGMTWGDFFGYFAKRFGLSYQTESEPVLEHLVHQSSRGMFGSIKKIGQLPESKALLKAIAWNTPAGSMARQWLESKPKLKRRAKRLAGLGTAAVYRADSGSPAKPPLRILPRMATVRSDLARQEIGWESLISRAVCMDRVGDWLQYANIVG